MYWGEMSWSCCWVGARWFGWGRVMGSPTSVLPYLTICSRSGALSSPNEPVNSKSTNSMRSAVRFKHLRTANSLGSQAAARPTKQTVWGEG